MQYTRELLPQIASISERFHEARSNYMNDHKTFQIAKDARLTIYSHCIVAIDIPSDSWWDSLPKKIIELGISKPLIQKTSPDNLKLIMEAVDSYWQYSIFILLFSSLESSTTTLFR
jgi:hypothetical protein